MDQLLVNVRRRAAQDHHFGVGQLIHHQLAHVLAVTDKGVRVGKHHFLIDAPIVRQVFVQLLQHPHPVVLDDDAVQLVLSADCGQIRLVDLAFVLDFFQIDVLPVEFFRLELVNAFLALQNQGLFPRIEPFVLHRFLNDVRFATLQKAGEQIDR